MFKKSSITGITLESAGLVALADLPTVAVRTALMGTASWLDILVLAPGMHQQQSADEVNRSEFPPTGSLTNGYVFRVENPATVSYLQRIGRTGHLVTAKVVNQNLNNPKRNPYFDLSPPQSHTFYRAGVSVALLYLLCPMLTVVVFALVGSIRDWWALAVLGILVLSRTINVFVVKRRVSGSKDWKGAKEEGGGGSPRGPESGSLGQWLRDEDRAESLAVGFATLLVYAAAALAGNASTIGSLVIAVLLICSVALLALCNFLTHRLQMYNCIVQEAKTLRTHYDRRLEMVKEPVKEDVEQQRYDCGIGRGREGKTGEWATQMGLIKDSELQAILQEFESPSKGSQAFSVSSTPADV